MFESLGMIQVAFMALSWYYMIGLFIFGLWFAVAAFSESLEGSSLMLLLFIGLTQYSGFYDVTSFSFLSLLYDFVVYLAIGCIWSLFKYKIVAKQIASEYIENWKNHEIEDLLRTSILQKISNRIDKSRIACWIIYFPFSILNFLLGDFIEYLVSKLGKVYNKIAEYVTDSVISENVKDIKKSEIIKD